MGAERHFKGERIGKLVLIEKVSPVYRIVDHARMLRWLCKCDCGNYIYSFSGNLSEENVHIKSCGCAVNTHWRGKERMSDNEASIKNLYDSYRHRAIKKNRIFNLSLEQFTSFIDKNCVYCGSPPKGVHHLKGRNVDITYNGIDRIDSSIGYEIDNCVTCCSICNKMKSDMPVEVFIEHVKTILEHQIKTNN